MPDNLRYQEPEPTPRSELASALLTGDEDCAATALIGIVFHDDEWRWCQEKCLSLLEHRSTAIRRAAAISLGHIARIHRQIEVDRVVPVLENLRDDAEIAGPVEDALGDIRQFVPNVSM